jgi:hypothetical protein
VLTNCRCRGLFLHLITLNDRHTRTRTRTHKHTSTHALGRTPLDEWWAQRTDLCLTTQNPHKRQASMPPAGF